MPYQLSWETRGVLMRYTGHVSDRDVSNVVCTVEADERFDLLLYGIHDFLGCESFTFAKAEIEAMAAIDAVAAQTLPKRTLAIAVVTECRSITAAVNAYVNSDFNLHDVRIFASMAAARAWISSVVKL